MSVKIGSARIDENGKAHGGKAGDQTGKEVSTQSWYRHAKGWRVLRAKDPTVAEKIARDMEYACANRNIGYDQYQRDTLYSISKPLGFNCQRVTTPCETDCSGLVRVCVNFAGISVGNFRTPDEAAKLLKTGAFVELTGSKYTDQSLYLGRGDILVTRTQGHTVVVLTNGSKFEGIVAPKEYQLGDRVIAYGMEGADVKVMQAMLIELGYDLGKWGADGDFGDCTEIALKQFQKDAGLHITGECNADTVKALNAALDKLHDIDEGCSDSCPLEVVGVGGNCYIRSAPNTDGRKLGVLHKGETLPYQGQTSDAGWLLVEYKGENGWVSPKYAKVVK